jgi:hypothetical protein
LRANRGRFDKAYLQTHDNMGEEFAQEVPGGKRFFRIADVARSARPINTLLEIAGIVLGLAGVLSAAYALWRHHTR